MKTNSKHEPNLREIIEKDELYLNYFSDFMNAHSKLELDAEILLHSRNKLLTISKKYQTIFAKAPIASFLINENTMILEANQQAAKMFDCNENDLKEFKFSDLLNDENVTSLEQHLQNAKNLKTAISCHLNLSWHNNDFYLEFYTIYLEEKLFLTMAIDITANKVETNSLEKRNVLLNKEMHAHNEMLKDVNQKLLNEIKQRNKNELRVKYLASITDLSKDYAVIKDLNLRIITANNTFLQLTNYQNLNDIIGKTDFDIFSKKLSQQTIIKYMNDDKKAQKLAQGSLICYEEEIIVRKREKIIFFTKKFPIFDRNNKLVATGTISRDITQLKKHEEELEREIYKLKQEIKYLKRRLI